MINTKVRTYINAGVGCGGVLGICRGGDGRRCGAGGPLEASDAVPPKEDGLSVEVLPNEVELPDPDLPHIKVTNFEYFFNYKPVFAVLPPKLLTFPFPKVKPKSPK